MDPKAYLEMAKTEAHHWWFLGRRNILRNILMQMHLPKNAHILEVGCGTGGNLEMLSAFGQVSAFDMYEDALMYARDKFGDTCKYQRGYCPDNIPFQDQKFDLICIFDVLEHIEPDLKTLVALKARLAEGGRILLTVPSYQWMWGGHDKFLHHKRRYTATSLAEKIASAGMTSERVSYFNTLLFPVAALVRLKEKLFKNKIGFGTDLPSKAVNKILTAVFSLEAYCLRSINFSFGVSMFAILNK